MNMTSLQVVHTCPLGCAAAGRLKNAVNASAVISARVSHAVIDVPLAVGARKTYKAVERNTGDNLRSSTNYFEGLGSPLPASLLYIPAEQHRTMIYSSKTASPVYISAEQHRPYIHVHVLRQNSIVCSYTNPGSGDPWEWRPITDAIDITQCRYLKLSYFYLEIAILRQQ